MNSSYASSGGTGAGRRPSTCVAPACRPHRGRRRGTLRGRCAGRRRPRDAGWRVNA
ncbi:hypothetical protein BURCENBC7_AP3821 [Burkholderia cenocepacia BC7]|nr:uncharacterized protein BCN122_II0543 [Burkholderia cenocepacia]EPZ90361.1 hypothetical protein BURCENK562V_C5609 [Burkholderia cenocepacia K56-2Valvano]ERI32141.1 hypothetical protein BURCENBC7_AP3821 [Burkholderia cenocepacia BC7]